MAYSTGLSKEGKKLLNTSTEDWEVIKNKLSQEDVLKLEENVKKEAIKMMKQVNRALQAKK
jgi:hypothetical protein